MDASVGRIVAPVAGVAAPYVRAVSRAPRPHVAHESPRVVGGARVHRLHRDGRGHRGPVEEQRVVAVGAVARPVVCRVGLEGAHLLRGLALVHHHVHPGALRRLAAAGHRAPALGPHVHREGVGEAQRHRGHAARRRLAVAQLHPAARREHLRALGEVQHRRHVVRERVHLRVARTVIDLTAGGRVTVRMPPVAARGYGAEVLREMAVLRFGKIARIGVQRDGLAKADDTVPKAVYFGRGHQHADGRVVPTPCHGIVQPQRVLDRRVVREDRRVEDE